MTQRLSCSPNKTRIEGSSQSSSSLSDETKIQDPLIGHTSNWLGFLLNEMCVHVIKLDIMLYKKS